MAWAQCWVGQARRRRGTTCRLWGTTHCGPKGCLPRDSGRCATPRCSAACSLTTQSRPSPWSATGKGPPSEKPKSETKSGFSSPCVVASLCGQRRGTDNLSHRLLQARDCVGVDFRQGCVNQLLYETPPVKVRG